MFSTRGTLESAGISPARLAGAMDANDLDLALVFSPENVFYVTGYPVLPTSGNPILYSLRNVFPFAVAIERSGERHLLCWGFSLQDVDVRVEHVVPFRDRTRATEALTSLLQTLSPKKVGVEATAPYATVARAREALPSATFSAGLTSMFLALRRVKQPREVELLQQSVDVAEGALEHVLSALSIGCSRLDMMRLAKQRVLELGGDGVGHITMNFGSANPEIAIDETMAPGSLAIVDVGAKLDGYTSDCRRYGFAGSVPSTLAERHEAMCQLVASVASRLRPGTPYRELYEVGSTGYQDLGLEPPGPLTHVGHGIGLETEEEWITDDPDTLVEEGMVVAIELYTPTGTGGNVGDEETYLVTSGEPRQMSRLSTAIRSF